MKHSPLNVHVERQLRASMDADLGLPPVGPFIEKSTPSEVPRSRRKRQLWFIRLPHFGKRAPETRQLRATTQKVTALVAHGKETIPDLNRTGKIDNV